MTTPSDIHALLQNANAALGYVKFIDGFIVPLLKRTGLDVQTRKTKRTITITVKLRPLQNPVH